MSYLRTPAFAVLVTLLVASRPTLAAPGTPQVAAPEVASLVVRVSQRVRMLAETADGMVVSGRRRPEPELRAALAEVSRALEDLHAAAAAGPGQNPAATAALMSAGRTVQAVRDAMEDIGSVDLSRASVSQREAFRRQLREVLIAADGLVMPTTAADGASPESQRSWSGVARLASEMPAVVALMAACGCLLLFAGFGVTPGRLLAPLFRRRTSGGSGDPNGHNAEDAGTESDEKAIEMQRLAAKLFSTDAHSAADRDLTTAVMGTIGDALIIVDQDGIIRTVNQATCDLLGYDKADLVGRSVDEIVLAGDDATPEWRTQDALRDVTVKYLTRDRQILPMSLSMAPVRDASGNLLGTIGVARDMRDRIRLVAEVEQARDAALELSRIKSEFLANMSHEIRTPMNAIIGYTDIALEAEIAPVQRGYLDAVRRAAVALLGIINEVLDFSRIEAGKLSLEKLPFSLREVVQETLRTLAVRSTEKGLELGCDVGVDVPDGVIGDPNRLRQVLVNLVSNALKFTDSGQVLVRVSAEVSAAPDQVMLHFAVADSGIGIPADKLDLIFHPFTQADGSMSRTYGGTGLGLAIATQLVELMGGRIRVESEMGQGSVFHFTILAGLSGDESRGQLPMMPHLRGVRVLLVEDNVAVREIEEQVLRGMGMNVESTADAETALNLIETATRGHEPFALLVTDIGLPGADGFELLEYLLRDPTMRSIPMVVLGRATKPAEVARSRTLGVAFVGKPVVPAELLEASCQALGVDRASMEQYGVAAAAPAPLRVLVAEDNPLNRRMIGILLEQQGHTVVSVTGGRDAVESVCNDAFDVVLMDLQMPAVDGFQATAEIRAWQEGRAVRVPIIALTGHALPGDRDRCLRAGMDGFLTKPIEADILMDTLARLVPHASISSANTRSGLPPSVIDAETLLQRVARNREAVNEIVMIFREDARTLRTDVEASMASRDGDALERAAARFAGSFRAIAAPAAAAAAADLQEKAHQRDFHRAREVWSDLSRELDKLEPALTTLLESDQLD